jgi:hypothetical protein
MTRNARLVLAAALAFGAAGAGIEGRAATYPAMAPLEQYMIADRAAEIALARTAAPAAISNDATVMVLGRSGYETAAKGGNGFVCLVERAWMSPFDAAEFWNPRNRSPICFNPPAARSILPYTLKRTALVLEGQPKARIFEAISAAVAHKDLPTPEPGAMSYMMSRQQYLNDGAGNWMPHLMFHIPKTDGASWGANLAGSPIILDTAHTQVPEPQSIFMVSAGTWSDGTPFAPAQAHGH